LTVSIRNKSYKKTPKTKPLKYFLFSPQFGKKKQFPVLFKASLSCFRCRTHCVRTTKLFVNIMKEDIANTIQILKYN
jgi:hypothetical protein